MTCSLFFRMEDETTGVVHGPMVYVFPDVATKNLWSKEADNIRDSISGINERWIARGETEIAGMERYWDGDRWIELVLEFCRRWTPDYLPPDIERSFHDVHRVVDSNAATIGDLRGPNAILGLSGFCAYGLADAVPANFIRNARDAHLYRMRVNSFGIHDLFLRSWLHHVRTFVNVYGVGAVPGDLQAVVAREENRMLRYGLWVVPIFRANLTWMDRSGYELNWCLNEDSWVYGYALRNGTYQGYSGLPIDGAEPTKNLRFVRGALRLHTNGADDGRMFVVQFGSGKAVRDWRQFLINTWEFACAVSQFTGTRRDEGCRGLMDVLRAQLRRPDSELIYTLGLRGLLHELEDQFGLARTAFPDPLVV